MSVFAIITYQADSLKGKNRVTQKIQKVNGETTSVVTIQTEQLSEPVKEIVVKGGKESDNYSGSGYGSVVPTKIFELNKTDK